MTIVSFEFAPRSYLDALRYVKHDFQTQTRTGLKSLAKTTASYYHYYLHSTLHFRRTNVAMFITIQNTIQVVSKCSAMFGNSRRDSVFFFKEYGWR